MVIESRILLADGVFDSQLTGRSGVANSGTGERASSYPCTRFIDNLALCCTVCNRFKGSDIASVDPDTGQVTANSILGLTSG